MMKSFREHPGYRRTFKGFLLLLIGLLVSLTPASAQQGPDPSLPAQGQAAIDALGSRLPAVANAYGMNPLALRQLLKHDSTLHVDNADELLYVDEKYPDDEGLFGAEEEGMAVDAIPVEETFLLHSLPGADHTIYLDFDGHTTTGTTWNNAYGVPTITSPAYDIDGDPNTFNSTEISRIQTVWQIVAEDFRPFDVNVTTEDPGSAALSYQGAGDSQWGTRVVITDDTFASCGCGGHAYIGSFDDSQDEPVFVYNSSLKGVSEASSHEVGHAINLAHDGTSSVTYYGGHGSGETSWAPIMGASYNRNVTHWSQNEYYNANNTGSGANYGNGDDDLAVIASLSNGNGFGYRVDDHGDDAPGASALTAAGSVVSGAGIIERTSDVDVFSFSTGAGQVSLDIQQFTPGPNLDVLAKLYDVGWNLVATSDPANVLDASISMSLAAGGYYLSVEGTGTGDPLNATPTGYTEYGSLGEYAISGTIVDAGGINNPPAFLSDPVVEADAAEGVAYSGTLADDASDPDANPLSFSKVNGPAWLNVASDGALSGTPASSDVGLNSWTVQVDDGQGENDQATLEIEVIEAPQFVDFTATGDVIGFGTVSGGFTQTHSDNGAAQSITEVESGGKPSRRHSRLDHRWTFSVLSGASMSLYANAWAPLSSDGDSFELSYSTDNNNFVSLGTLSATGDGEGYQIFSLPNSLNGTVYLRVEDSDRTQGNRDLDTVFIDHLFIRSDTQLPDPPSAPSGLSATAVGAAQIDLGWIDESATETGFRLERSPDGVGAWSQVAELGSGVTGYSDTGLASETLYFYRVVAFNAAGNSAFSNTASDTTGVAGSMHVDALSGSTGSSRGGRWDASVQITIVDQLGGAVAGATVSGSWSNGANGGASCVTDAAGQCTVTKSNLKNNVTSVTFTVTDVQHAANSYAPGSNVVSSIVVNQ